MIKTTGRSLIFDRMVVVALLTIVGAAFATVVAISPSETLRIERLVSDLSNAKPETGRLFMSRAAGIPEAVYTSTLGDAQVAVLSMKDSFLRQRVQSLIDLGRRNWQKAATSLESLSEPTPEDSAILNDLAVAYLNLGDQDAIYYFKAIALL